MNKNELVAHTILVHARGTSAEAEDGPFVPVTIYVAKLEPHPELMGDKNMGYTSEQEANMDAAAQS